MTDPIDIIATLAFWWGVLLAAFIVVLLAGMAWLSVKDRIERDIDRSFGYDERETDALALSVLISEMTPTEDLSNPLYVPTEWEWWVS